MSVGLLGLGSGSEDWGECRCPGGAARVDVALCASGSQRWDEVTLIEWRAHAHAPSASTSLVRWPRGSAWECRDARVSRWKAVVLRLDVEGAHAKVEAGTSGLGNCVHVRETHNDVGKVGNWTPAVFRSCPTLSSHHLTGEAAASATVDDLLESHLHHREGQRCLRHSTFVSGKESSD